MEELQRKDLLELMRDRGKPAISIYLPTHVAGQPVQQNRIRFKNLVRQAQKQLPRHGLRPPAVRELLAPMRELLNDDIFWRNQSLGLAVFMAPEFYSRYRLPLSFAELVLVADTFHTKPLLPLVMEEAKFYVLALSKHEIRLLECGRFAAKEVTPAAMPRSLESALDEEPEEQLLFHVRVRAGGSMRPGVYHGQGPGMPDEKDRILRFFRQVDEGAHPVLAGRQEPLVLAGAEPLLAIYREANTYPRLFEAGVSGNVDGLPNETLHRMAWPLIEPLLHAPRDLAASRYRELAGTGRSSMDVEAILVASAQGRVDSLFVALQTHCWGHFDPETGGALIHAEYGPTDEDLLDVAAKQTFLHGGTVYAAEQAALPDGAPLAALFRY